MKIKSIRKLNKKFDRYDLTVNTTNNFYANGILIHNTSLRLGHQKVHIEPQWLTKISKYLPSNISSTFKRFFSKYEYELIAGSRRCIKTEYLKGGPSEHFYKSDIWTQALQKIGHLIPKNYQLFGEIVGWVGDTPIQKNYTYDVPKGQFEIYIYRIAIINEDGYSCDLSTPQMIEFCNLNGLKYCPLLWIGRKGDLNLGKDQYEDYFLDKNLHDIFPQCVPLSDPKSVDEGTCLRIDGIIPKIYKHKSPIFYEHETKMLDKEVIDIESEES